MINQNEIATSKIGVTLRPSALKENLYVARVPRNTVSMDALLNGVVEHNQGIDKYQIAHAAELLKREVAMQLGEGRAVSLLDIGTVYVAPKGGVVSGSPEDSDITGFVARFSASDEIKESLAKMSASVTAVLASNPIVKEVVNPLSGAADGTLKATYGARLLGQNLRIGGEEGGIFFAPIGADGETDGEETWIEVENALVTANTCKRLEFYLPRNVEAGQSYRIVLRTSVTASGTARKCVLEGRSQMVRIVE